MVSILCFLSAYAGISILFGRAVYYVLEISEKLDESIQKGLFIFLNLCCLLQFSELQYNFKEQIPTKESIAKEKQEIKQI